MFNYYLYRDMSKNGMHCEHIRAYYADLFGVVKDRGCIVEVRAPKWACK